MFSVILGAIWGLLSTVYLIAAGLSGGSDTPLILRLPELPLIIGATFYSTIAGVAAIFLGPLLQFDTSGTIGFILFFSSPIIIFSIIIYFLVDLFKLLYSIFNKIPL